MFLNSIIAKNRELLEIGFQLHQEGRILPNSYIIDMDSLLENARNMVKVAKDANIALYFMLKQFGHNPYIAKELIKLGYEGAVVVDFKEAEVMMKHEIPISNVGHLVQMPRVMIQELVDYGCKYMTVFSLDKIRDIDACAKISGIKQKLILKVVGKHDHIYSGQTAGFHLEELADIASQLRSFEHIVVAGVTSFPCFLYDEKEKIISPTENLKTLFKAKEILEEHGWNIENVNAPSATCSTTLKKMAFVGINSAEPGHGLSGTTPFHVTDDCIEKPCVIYVSEISHNFDCYGYCYGGGYYRRSHMRNALVGTSINNMKQLEVLPPLLDSIDYYLQLTQNCKVNDTVIMAFRFQIFVTRSNVVLVEGLHTNKDLKLSKFDSLGNAL